MIVQKPGFLPKDALQPANYVKNPVANTQSAIANCLIKKTSYPNPQLLEKVGGLNIITDIFKKSSYLGAKNLVKLRYIIPLGSFNLYCKMLFWLIATDVKKLTVVGEAFQTRNI